MLISKKIAITAGMFAIVALSVAASLPKPKDDDDKFQNLKVLPKNITDKNLDHIMDEWAASLGVHCNFCHARNEQTNKMDFASDAKPEKTAARHMLLMMNKINKKFFDAKKDSLGMVAASGITCNTCHNGKEHPEAVWPKREHKMGPPPAAPGTPPAGNTPPPPAQH